MLLRKVRKENVWKLTDENYLKLGYGKY